MAAPTLAEFTTALPNISEQVFTKKDLRCIRILALSIIATSGIVTPVADYSANLANSATSLVAVAMALIGKISDSKFDAARTQMYAGRTATAFSSNAAIMTSIRKLRQCNEHELNAAESYIEALLFQSIGL